MNRTLFSLIFFILSSWLSPHTACSAPKSQSKSVAVPPSLPPAVALGQILLPAPNLDPGILGSDLTRVSLRPGDNLDLKVVAFLGRLQQAGVMGATQLDLPHPPGHSLAFQLETDQIAPEMQLLGTQKFGSAGSYTQEEGAPAQAGLRQITFPELLVSLRRVLWNFPGTAEDIEDRARFSDENLNAYAQQVMDNARKRHEFSLTAQSVSLADLPGASVVPALANPSDLIPHGTTLAPSQRAPPAEVSAYLNSLPSVRIFFSRAPGFGHQMATLSLVRRLRDLGYQGRIEAIYGGIESDQDIDFTSKVERGLNYHLAQKLGILIPEFDPNNTADQYIPRLNMTLRSVDTFKRDNAPVALALTGGADQEILFNSALNADVFLRLGPWDWGSSYQDEIWVHDWIRRELEPNNRFALIYRPTSEQEIHAGYFSRLSRARFSPQYVRGLSLLVQEINRNELLPAYGLARFDEWMLHRLLLAVSYAMDKNTHLFTGRGVVIPLLVGAEDTVLELSNVLAHAELIFQKRQDLVPERRQAIVSANQKLRSRLKVKSIKDDDLLQTLRHLGPGQILVLKTGAAPPELFELFFAKSTLPPTVEGKNAINLARLLGIPFLPTLATSYGDLLDLNHIGPENLDNPGWLMLTGPGALQHGSQAYDFETIGEFISAARTPGSALRKKFQKGQIHQDDYHKDKLIRAIQKLLSLPR